MSPMPLPSAATTDTHPLIPHACGFRTLIGQVRGFCSPLGISALYYFPIFSLYRIDSVHVTKSPDLLA